VGKVWWVPLLVGVAHALQHVALPLVFEPAFMLWRFGMFLPFAVFLGYVIDRRPSLLPYMMVVHGLLDLQLPIMLFLVANGMQPW
jgi:membrane protease YdiL (CAAX protease family)